MATNRKSRTHGKKKTKPELVPYAPPDLATTRQRVTDVIVQHAVEMVDATIDVAKNGQYAAMKCLFETIGLFSLPEQAPAQKDDSLAQTLLHRLGLMDSGLIDSQAPGGSIRKDSQSAPKP